MIKKTKLFLLTLMVAVVMLPAVVSAADWGLGIGSGGISGGVSGRDGGFSFGLGSGSGSGGGWNLGGIAGFGLPSGSITGIITNILVWLLMLFGVIGVIGFVISGLMYIMASGNEKLAEQAKEAMKYSIIGVLVGIAGFVIIQAINAILSAGPAI